MELIYKFSAVFGAVVFVILGWRLFDWVWLRPQKLEKYLRQQGFNGNSYRVLFGDTKEMAMIAIEAKSKPIKLSDDIVPRIVPHIHKTIKKYGKNSFSWLGPRPMVNIMDPDMIREVLNKNYQFQRLKGGNPLAKLFATGLVDCEGDKWTKHRKIITPAFNLEKMKNMLPAFYLSCSEIISQWQKMISTNGQCELDVWPCLETLTSDAISRTAFGSSYEEGRRIFQLQKEQADIVVKVSQSIYIPGMKFLPTKINKRMKEIAKEVKEALRSIIEKRVNTREAGETSPDDLLGILLNSNSNEMRLGNKNSGMSIDEVIEECKLFYIVGQQTTANLLVWTMILLSHHQDWQNRARDEVLQAFGNEKPDIDGLNHLKIVNMILLEVLRLYPPGASLIRTIYEETKLGEVSLPAGVITQLPIILLHHDDEIWGDDAKEFKPKRFSEGVSKAMGRGAYFPFGWGPRICLGQNFAMLEAKMAVAMILQHFSFVLSPSYAHAPHVFMTLEPQHGAHLILQTL